MSAALRILDTMPNASTSPRRPSKPTPHRYTASSTFTFAVTDNLLRDMLRMASMLKDATGEPYSFEAACASIMLDRDGRGEKNPIDYQRIWGWTRQQYRDRRGDIDETIEQWKTMFGRSKKNHKRTTQEPQENHKHPPPAKESAKENHGRTTEEPHENPLTNTALTEEEEKKKEERARTVIRIPTSRRGEEFAITVGHVEEFRECYDVSDDGIDIEAELGKMRAWSIANEGKRKTAAGMLRFVNGWLGRAQDDAKKNKRGDHDGPGKSSSGVRGSGYGAGNRTRRGAERSDEERIDEFERSILIAESIIARGTGG